MQKCRYPQCVCMQRDRLTIALRHLHSTVQQQSAVNHDLHRTGSSAKEPSIPHRVLANLNTSSDEPLHSPRAWYSSVGIIRATELREGQVQNPGTGSRTSVLLDFVLSKPASPVQANGRCAMWLAAAVSNVTLCEVRDEGCLCPCADEKERLRLRPVDRWDWCPIYCM